MKNYTPKLILLASALAVAGMFAIPVSSDKTATNDGPRTVAAAKKKGGNGQGDDRSEAKGDNGNGGKKKGGGKKGGKKK